MRYRGGGIGHRVTWSFNETLLRDNPEEELLEECEHQQTRPERTDDESQSEQSDESGSESDGYAAL